MNCTFFFTHLPKCREKKFTINTGLGDVFLNFLPPPLVVDLSFRYKLSFHIKSPALSLTLPLSVTLFAVFDINLSMTHLPCQRFGGQYRWVNILSALIGPNILINPLTVIPFIFIWWFSSRIYYPLLLTIVIVSFVVLCFFWDLMQCLKFGTILKYQVPWVFNFLFEN
jgi:hypothetical protein